ncbi:MAG: CARDB domain-containing protein [Acidobacteriota bacterium]
MRRILYYLLGLALLVPTRAPFGYEDQTHQALTRQAVKIATQDGVPATFFTDDQVKAIIAGSGKGPESGHEPDKTDGEDYTKYKIEWSKCPDPVTPKVSEGEPLHHFASSMLFKHPALPTFLRFYGDAVLLWKKGYRRQAAFILGRAIHLVEDMAQPQHAMNEAHPPYWVTRLGIPLAAPNISFVEEYAEANIRSGGQLCERWQYDYAGAIGQLGPEPLDTSFPWMAVPDMAQKSRAEGQRYLEEQASFTRQEVNAAFGTSYKDPFCHLTYPGSDTCVCQPVVLPFQFSAPVCSSKAYKDWIDFETDYAACANHPDSLRAKRVDMAMKMAQGKMDLAIPNDFEHRHVTNLLTPGVAYAAGVVVAFWNEVKDSCGGSTAKESSGTCLACLTDRPSGESPDDSVSVKASSRTESGAVPAPDDWRDVCRVGIEKGLASMAAYGVSSSLMEQLAALDANTDPSVAQALYDRLEVLEARYSGPQNMMPQDVASAPEVAVWEKGFGGSARSLVEAMREPVAVLEEPQEPVFTDEESLSLLPPGRGLLEADPAKQKILVLPTGSLYGLRADSTEAQALKGFVEGGGVAVSFTQPYGDDFSALPVPAGQTLQAAGYKQDLSCFADSAYPTMEHPILSGITRTTVTAGFDGYFRTIPTNATVLLRRTISGEPCLILYPVGQGYVVASTLYEDWGYANGQSTADGRSIMANILAWAKSPNQSIPVTNLSTGASASGIAVTLHVRNLSDTAVDQMEVLVMTPDRQTVAAQASLSVSVPAHAEADVPVTVDLSSYFGQSGAQRGVFHADYRLLAIDSMTGQEEEIQPQGETETGRFAVEAAGADRQTFSQTVFSTWTDDDVAGNPAKTVHIHIEDHTGTARTMHLWTCYLHEDGVLLDNITLAPNGILDKDVTQDLSRPGPYHYYLTDPIYGFIPSGWWAWMFGNDRWRMAGQGFAYMFGNGGPAGEQRYVSISKISGMDHYYQPTDTVVGSVTIGNLRSAAEEVTVTFALAGADRTVTQSQTVHLEGGASQAVPFSLALPGAISYYCTASVSAGIYLGGSLVGGTSETVAVDGWQPYLVLAPQWPSSPDLATLATTPLAVHVMNQPGDRVADSAGYGLWACVREVTDAKPWFWPKVEEQTVTLPDLHPGEAADVTVHWTQWQPVLGKTYSIQLAPVNVGWQWPSGGVIGHSISVYSPFLYAHVSEGTPGEATAELIGEITNCGDLSWEGQLQWSCQALGLDSVQAATASPKHNTLVSFNAPRPDGVVPGDYPFTMTFTAPGLTAPLTTQGTLHVVAPEISLVWPGTQPVFRHDEDGALPVQLSIGRAAGPLAATFEATMNWKGGSAAVVSAQAVTLDPAQPAAVTLTLPMAQMPAPGPFMLQVTLHIPQGNIERSWSASYTLKGPAYSGGFSNLTVAPGATLMGEIQNAGTFEGTPQVSWALTDAKGMAVVEDNQSWPVAVGEAVPLSEPLPAALLPGSYTSTLIVTDPDAGQATILRQNLAVTGTMPTLTLSTDRSIYGTASPLALNLHVEDPAQALDGSWAHLEVQHYLGLAGQGGGVAGPPSASWNSSYGDGSGNCLVNPSEWFVDPSTGRGGYARDVRGELAPGEIPSIAADINGDGKAELIGTSGLNVSISSQGDLGAGMLKRFAPMVHRLVKSKGISLAGGRAEADFHSWLTIPVSTWSQPEDSWTSVFLLGIRDDGLGSSNPLFLGLSNNSGKLAALLVRWDGTVIWRQDLTASRGSSSQVGPVFGDLNGDGTGDVLFTIGDTLYALNGATGETLWTYACPQYAGPVFRVGHAAGAARIWVASSPSSGETLTLLDDSGQRIYQTVPDGGLEPSSLVAGDVDGDGNDEAVVAQAWNGASPPLEIFHVDGPAPTPTSLVASSPVDLFDINGDGKAEALFVMATHNADGSMTQSVVAAHLTTGDLTWISPLPDVPTDYHLEAVPVLYRPREGQAKLVLCEYSAMLGIRESYQPVGTAYLLDAATGTLEQSVGGTGHFYTLVAGDFDADGVSELYSDGILLDNGCLAPDGTGGPCEEWETVWQGDGPISENGQPSLDLSPTVHPMAIPGTYRVVATAWTDAGQSLDAQPAGFSVVDTTLGLMLAPAADTTIRTDESLGGTVTLINTGTATESSITVSLLVDGQTVSMWQVPSLDPGSEQDFPFSLVPAAAGKHTLEVQATENGTALADLRSAYVSASPQVAVTLDAPASHTEAPFTLAATVANTGLVPVQVSIALSDDPGHPANLALPPQASSPVSFARQSSEAYAAQLTVSGDVQQTLAVAVPYAYQLALSVPGIGPQQTGTVSVPVHVTQSGGSPYSGSLTATVTQAGAVVSTSIWPIQVAGGGSADLTLPLSIITPGTASLHLAAALTGATADASLVLYQGGIGTLAITLPPTLGEGAASIPFTVQNGLATQGSFDVQLLWNGGGGAQPVAESSLSVAGSGSGSSLLVPTLTAGTGTLQALLNGVVAASQSVTVLPLVQASLTLTPVQPADGPPAVNAVVANTGYAPLDATLAVQSDTASASSIHVDAGGLITQTIAVNTDGFGGADAPVSATLYLPDGTTITRAVTLTLQPAQLTVTPPAAPAVLTPGQVSSLPFTITNTGDLPAPLLFSVDFPDGEQEHFEQTVQAPGHSSSQVAVAIPLSWDIPNGSANAHYVVRRTGGTQAVLAEGDLPVTIQGPTVSVSASLDGVAYAAGAAATANVAFSLTPPDAAPETLTVRVIGGSFEDERLVTVAGNQSETFAVPIVADTDGVSVEVVQAGGRSLYINRFRVYPLGGGFSIHPDRSVYQAGEIVTVSANLPSAGSLHLNFMGQDVTLQGSGTVSQAFILPADTAEDSYSVAYDYTPTDTTAFPASGGMPVDVHGVFVTGGESHLDKSTYATGESLSGQIVLYTNQALTGTLKFWIVDPDGSYGYASDQAVTLAPGAAPGAAPGRFPFALPFATTQSGTHRLAYSLVGSSGTAYVGGSLPFQVGTGVLLGVAASQYAYPQGTETASLQLRTAGTGAATVTVNLDGTPAAQSGLALNGVQTSALGLGSVSPGEHAVTATLTDSAGLVSVARCRFIYGSGLPDLTGSVSAACRTGNVLPVFLVVTNGGAGPAGASTASLYDGDLHAGGALISAVPVPALSAGAEFTFEYDWGVTGGDGIHNLSLVVDSQGAVKEWDETNNTSHVSVTVGPEVAVAVTPPDQTCSAQPIVPSAQTTPAGTQVTVTLDGAPYAWGTPIADEGDHMLTVTAPNGCGDTNTTLTVHYTIDLMNPVVQISGVADGGSYNVPVQPTFQATDLHLTQTTAQLNGETFASGTTLTTPGAYTLVVTATDCAGNTGEASAHFAVSGSSTPALPPSLPQVAWFGCDSLNVNGTVKLYGVTSVGGAQGFGGNVASNGSITVSGSNVIDGNATPGPGQSVRMTGKSGQVLGSTDPASATVPCDEQRAADWLAYATDHNDNAQVPAQYLDKNGNFKLNGNKTCTLPGGTYLVNSFTVNGNGSLVAAGAVTFVITGSVTINGSCKVNDGGAPQNLVLVSASTQSVMLNGSTRVSLELFAPLAPVTVNGNLTGYGNLWGKTLLGNGGVVWNRVQAGAGWSSGSAKSAGLQDERAPVTLTAQAMGGVLRREGENMPAAQRHGEARWASRSNL